MLRSEEISERFALVAGPPVRLPLFGARVSAGFPSPCDDFLEDELDIAAYLVRHRAATFFVRVAGDSMAGAGILPGDVLVVDRSIEPEDGQVVVAALDGELVVKRLRLMGERVRLEPENPAYPALEVEPQASFEVWGVVRAVARVL